MKYTKIILGGLVALTTTAQAMPTQEQTKKVEPLVMDLMRDDQTALKSGKKTRVEVAESAMELAEKADSEAAKLLLMKGAFNLYVRAGEFDKAIDTLQSLQAAIPDMPPANMANIIEAALRVVPRKNGGQLYRLLDETKTRMRYTNEAASLEKSVKQNPADRSLRLKLAEHYAYLGKWDMALENFAATDGKVGAIAKSERGGEAATEKIADFWWAYPTGKADELVKCFRTHAAKLYEDAIAAGKITGLNKVQAERRIEEAKEFGENIFEVQETGDGLYCIIDLSGGADAKKFAVTYSKSLPSNGLTDEYRTTKIILRRIEPGSLDAGLGKKFRITKPFYIGVFEVTRTQYGLVCGRNTYNSALPETRVSWLDLRGSQRGNSWPKSFDVDDDSFMGRIRAKTGLVIDLPTEVQWEYACRAGTKSIYNNGGDKESDLFEVGVCKENKKGDDPVKVGSYKPNKWGLYDMHGNAWEWCLDRGKDGWDMFDWSKEPKETLVDPRGPESGTWHFVRGGGVGWKSNWCGSSQRHCIKDSDRHGDGGFRIVIQPEAYAKGVATNTKQPVTTSFKTGVKPGTITALKIADDCDIEFAYCPEGKMNILFKKPDQDSFRKQSISHGYWLSRSPITVLQWQELMGEDSGQKNDKGIATGISDVAMQKCLDVLNRRYASKLPAGYEFRFPTSAEYSQAQAAMQGNRDNPYWPVDDNPADWKSAKVVPDTPNPWGLVMLGSFGCMLYDTTDCKEDVFKSKEATDNGRLTGWGGRPWYAFEEKLPLKDPVLITKNGYHLMSGFKSEVYRKSCFVAPNDKAALRVCIGRKIK